jgi:acetyltransferase-like isoleucine patch superfamily enzyme
MSDAAFETAARPATQIADPYFSLWRQVRERPGALRYLVAILRGAFYVRWYRLRGIRFSAGARLRVYGRLRLKGPGEVIFGSDVIVFDTVTPWTHAPGAKIVVGDNVILGGTRFGCVQEITIGSNSIVADARIMDTDFHSIRADRRSGEAPVRVAPVHIHENVWIGAAAAVLADTSVGMNSVVGFGAVCMGHYPANKVILGNPARAVMPLPTV